MPDRVRSIKMPDSLWNQVKKEAKSEDRSASWVIRMAIENYLNSPKEVRVRHD